MGIHRIDQERELGSEGFTDSSGEVETSVGYTEGKDEEGKNITIALDKKECYAKMVTIAGESGLRYKYYVKFGVSGSMFNPWGLFSEGTQRSLGVQEGKQKEL